MSVRTKHLSGTVIRERSAPGPGPALWSPADPDSGRHYLWPGRGTGLYLVDGDGISPVTHPAANGQYNELKEARGALARLLAGRAAHATRAAGHGDPARSGRPARPVIRAAGRAARNRMTAGTLQDQQCRRAD